MFNAFQTFVGKATGKIKPTKSYSDYYVFLCSFSIGLVGQLYIFYTLEWELGILFSFHGKLCLRMETADMLKGVRHIGISYNRENVINVAFPNFWWVASYC